MSEHQTTITYLDPRYFEEFDGDPFEAAGKAMDQARNVAKLLRRALDDAEVLVRNAELERNLQETPHDARAETWDDTAQARRLAALKLEADAIAKSLLGLRTAATFNPKRPPKEA